MDLPILHYSPIFADEFQYRGAKNLPGSGSIPDHWTVASGTFTTSSEIRLECTAVGELVYSGTDLDDLRTVDIMSDYAYKIWFPGQENLILTLGTQRLGVNRINLTVDFENNRIRLFRVAGASVLVGEVDHNLDAGGYYLLELWTFESTTTTRYVVILNGDILMDEDVTSLPDADGFSLTVDQLPTGDVAIFYALRVYDLTEEPDPDPNPDPSDLIIFNRTEMKESIENPKIKNWDTFKAAHKLYKFHKDLGQSDDSWMLTGYPIRAPSTEDWFK